ncbi:MAG: hypothetical protein KDB80_01005, partial [Planctomycetes bacterium]|nr:hypothetical protein [Planctomycetota bacterium]
MSCFLGIDGGGTALRWCCVDATGSVVERGKRAPAHPTHGDVAPVADALAGLLAELEPSFAPSAVVIGLAGAGAASVRSELMRGLRTGGVVRDVVLCGDVEVAAAAAFGPESGVAA